MATLTRVARTAATTLTHVFEVDETPTAATGDVTVTVTDPAGAQVATGAATKDDDNQYTYKLPGQPQLTLLTATWKAAIDDAEVVEVDQVEVVGGFLVTLKQGRDSDKDLANTDLYTTADLKTARLETEQELEWICDQAFVPRYRRVTLDGSGTTDLVLPGGGDEVRGGYLMRGARTVRSAAIAPAAGQPAVPLTAQQLAALTIRPGGVLRRTDGALWTAGESNVVLEYEYGSDAPPADLVKAALTRFRSRLQMDKTQVPDRAVSFTIAELGTYRLSLPDAFRTGIPDVDAAYERYSRRVNASDAPGGKSVPASRTLSYEPQYGSMFHAGRSR